MWLETKENFVFCFFFFILNISLKKPSTRIHGTSLHTSSSEMGKTWFSTNTRRITPPQIILDTEFLFEASNTWITDLWHQPKPLETPRPYLYNVFLVGSYLTYSLSVEWLTFQFPCLPLLFDCQTPTWISRFCSKIICPGKIFWFFSQCTHLPGWVKFPYSVS